MTIRLLALLACLPFVGAAQLRVFVVDGEAERELTAQFDMGKTDPGDAIETRFRVRNSGVSAGTVQILTLGGAGFSFSNRPSIPYIIAPGFFMDFRVKFEPTGPGSYSASLTVNSITAILRASSPPVLTLTAEGVVLTTSSPLNFGKVELGSSAARRIVIANNTSGALTLSTVALSGEAFELETVLTLPRVLQPRTAVNLETIFTPKVVGSFEGKLLVNDRLFTLKGSAASPPVPRATISISPAVTSSGKQPKVSVELASPAAFAVTGVLTLGFQANASHSDPTILFVRGGSKSIGFTVAQGETRATFPGGETETVLQTGTTAGTITLQIVSNSDTLSIAIPASPVVVDMARGTRTASGLDIELTGFDNTRSVSQLRFQFFDRNGRAIGSGPVSVDAGADFRSFFDASALGGVFSLRASFPVSGDASQIAGAEVELVNSA
ncbi:MAG TPA: choice-of-anchor D domain-containing protein, partial [Bryobacteraceae bacterium]|nr:choice-of-anchor D domain-containing protein [Bryobacteraceae bacterium]